MTCFKTKKRRRGTSLVETVVLVGITSMTLTTVSMLTHSIYRSSSQLTAHSQVRKVHARLVVQIHRDDFEGKSGALPTSEDGEIYRVSLADGRVASYRKTLKTLERHLINPQGKIEQREQYVLPHSYQFVEAEPLSNLADIELQIHQNLPPDQSGKPRSIPTGLRVSFASYVHSRQNDGANP